MMLKFPPCNMFGMHYLIHVSLYLKDENNIWHVSDEENKSRADIAPKNILFHIRDHLVPKNTTER
jgi:hypothetical protein